MGGRPASGRGGKPPGSPSLLPRRRAQPLRSRCGAAPCPRRSPARLSSLQPRVRAALAPRRSPGSARREPSLFAFVPVPSAATENRPGSPFRTSLWAGIYLNFYFLICVLNRFKVKAF